ncbi:hypothetical protein K458DRAFT_392078 [Lentithecium fluviatile CBS 122367]|uniref:Uncharacterized protein n=1 Tax=Lentithecium fluviatile CBS 122367 TaxID=1168545 RepID=A0A6G1ISZ7_9PLEO|nr:hypothetical protein K458DRAFT_392078 [Lentithecium fluviatile CBS 122367]
MQFPKSFHYPATCLARGADPNAPSANTTHTILHCAAQHASVGTWARLLAAGADISPTSPSAGLVANAASVHSPTNDRIPVISYLLDHGAGIDLLTERGVTTRETHTVVVFLHLVELLLERDADGEIKTWSLTTKMKGVGVEELAEICGREEVGEILRRQRINRDAAAKL